MIPSLLGIITCAEPQEKRADKRNLLRVEASLQYSQATVRSSSCEHESIPYEVNELIMSDLGVEPAMTGRQASSSRKKRRTAAFIVFAAIWLLLIGGGIYGAKLYTDNMRLTITHDIERQTSLQVEAMQKAYDERLNQLEATYNSDIAALQEKVDALNELLTFTKDNADNKTDNSNKLYTQLNEVKKQLAELKKNLDVLK